MYEHVFKKWKEGEWAHVIDSSSQEVKRCLQIGVLCVQYRAVDRPIISSVVVMLLTEKDPILQPTHQITTMSMEVILRILLR